MSDSDQKPVNVPFSLPAADDDDILTSVSAEPRPTPALGLPVIEAVRKPEPAKKVYCRLRVRTGTQELRVDVEQNPFQIGGRHGDLVLDTPYISPFHAQIRLRNGKLTLEDLGSKNGVFLRIADELSLEDFDEIAVGEQRLQFRTGWDGTGPKPEADPSIQTGATAPPHPARVIRYYDNGNIASVWMINDILVVGGQGTFPIAADPLLSTRHAQIEKRGNRYFIKDLNSEHGTYIRIHDPVELIEGDCFLIGRTLIRLEQS